MEHLELGNIIKLVAEELLARGNRHLEGEQFAKQAAEKSAKRWCLAHGR